LQEAGPMVFLGGKTGTVQGGTKKLVDKKDDNSEKGLTFENVAQEVLSDKEKEAVTSEDSTFSRIKEVPKDSAETDEEDSSADGSKVKHGNSSIPIYKFVFENSQPLNDSTEEAEALSAAELKKLGIEIQQEGSTTNGKDASTSTESDAKAAKNAVKIEVPSPTQLSTDKDTPGSPSENTDETSIAALQNTSEILKNSKADNIGEEGQNVARKNQRLKDKDALRKADRASKAGTTNTEPSAKITKDSHSPVVNGEDSKTTEVKSKPKEGLRYSQRENSAKLANKPTEEPAHTDAAHKNTAAKVNTSEANTQEASKFINAIKSAGKSLEGDGSKRELKGNEAIQKKGKAASYLDKQHQNLTVNRLSLQRSNDETSQITPPGESFTKTLEDSVLGQTKNKIFSMVKSGEMQADFQLEPPALGKLNMRIVTKGESIYTVINAESDTAKQILNKNQHLLRDSLESSGFQLEKFSVNVGGENGHRFNEQPETRKNTKTRKYSTALIASVGSLAASQNIASSGRLDISA